MLSEYCAFLDQFPAVYHHMPLLQYFQAIPVANLDQSTVLLVRPTYGWLLDLSVYRYG